MNIKMTTLPTYPARLGPLGNISNAQAHVQGAREFYFILGHKRRLLLNPSYVNYSKGACVINFIS
jgi:hypothetical protein